MSDEIKAKLACEKHRTGITGKNLHKLVFGGRLDIIYSQVGHLVEGNISRSEPDFIEEILSAYKALPNSIKSPKPKVGG